MSVATQKNAEQPGNPPRLLIVGSNLLAGALANVLEAYGFATAHVVPQASEVERWIEWHPNLVILDVRSLDFTAASAGWSANCSERPWCASSMRQRTLTGWTAG